ncbi:hypothetical protein B566_EDAN014975, partial [Ephemera danica]
EATSGIDESETWGEDSESFSPITVKSGKSKKKGSAANTVEAMNTRRRKHWLHIAKKEIGKSQKNMKESVWRMKRLTREMQTFWKRQDRVERETRRRMEREAEEQRKMDVEMME